MYIFLKIYLNLFYMFSRPISVYLQISRWVDIVRINKWKTKKGDVVIKRKKVGPVGQLDCRKQAHIVTMTLDLKNLLEKLPLNKLRTHSHRNSNAFPIFYCRKTIFTMHSFFLLIFIKYKFCMSESFSPEDVAFFIDN